MTDADLSDLGERQLFQRLHLPMLKLIEAADKAGRTLEGRRFENCLIMGPCVLGPSATTLFDGCDLGDARGDVRNLFLRAAGPSMAGVISIDGCVFEKCRFLAVGFAGSDAFVDHFVQLLGPAGPGSDSAS